MQGRLHHVLQNKKHTQVLPSSHESMHGLWTGIDELLSCASTSQHRPFFICYVCLSSQDRACMQDMPDPVLGWTTAPMHKPSACRSHARAM